MSLYGILSVAERLSLEAEHERVQSHALEIRKAMNNGNIVAVLPEHILVTIFQLYAADSGRPGIHGWFVISWVCSRWRVIALDAAALWTQIRVTDLAVVQCYLDRSKTLPLSVTGKLCDVPKKTFEVIFEETFEEALEKESQRDQALRTIGTWSSVLIHAARIENLTIDHDFRLKERHLRVSGLRHAKFPKLRSLVIEGRHVDELHVMKDGGHIPSLLRDRDEMPLLEEVATTSIPLRLALNISAPNLKKLDIGPLAHATPAAAWDLPWDTFFHNLGLFAGLQELSLAVFPLLPAAGPAHIPRTPLALPALTRLTLAWRDTDRAFEAAHFLAHTTLPKGCALHVVQVGAVGTVRSFNALCAAAVRAVATPVRPLSAFRVARVSDDAIQLACWTAEVPLAELAVPRPEDPRAPAPLLEMTVHNGSKSGLLGLLRLFPLHRVTRVALCDIWGDQFLSEVPVEGVRELLVSKSAAREAVQIGGSWAACLPALEVLRVVDVYDDQEKVEDWAYDLSESLRERGEGLPDMPRLRLVVDDPKLEDTDKWRYIVEPFLGPENVDYVKRM